jgi:hypothetical protein
MLESGVFMTSKKPHIIMNLNDIYVGNEGSRNCYKWHMLPTGYLLCFKN